MKTVVITDELFSEMRTNYRKNFSKIRIASDCVATRTYYDKCSDAKIMTFQGEKTTRRAMYTKSGTLRKAMSMNMFKVRRCDGERELVAIGETAIDALANLYSYYKYGPGYVVEISSAD